MRIMLLLLLCSFLLCGVVGAATHPLEPLTKDEIAMTVSVLKSSGKVTEASRFPVIVLNEPPKREVLAYKPGTPIRREAFVVV